MLTSADGPVKNHKSIVLPYGECFKHSNKLGCAYGNCPLEPVPTHRMRSTSGTPLTCLIVHTHETIMGVGGVASGGVTGVLPRPPLCMDPCIN